MSTFLVRAPLPAARRKEVFRRLLLAAGRRDLGREVRFLLLDSLTESIAHEARDFHRAADLALGLLHRLRHRFAGVVDEGLLEQADFLVVGLETGLDDLLDDVL